MKTPKINFTKSYISSINDTLLSKTIPSNDNIMKSIQEQITLTSQISLDTTEPQTLLQGYSAATKATPSKTKPIRSDDPIAKLIRKYKIHIDGLTTQDYEFKYDGNKKSISFSAIEINQILGAVTYFYQTLLMVIDATSHIEEEIVKQNQFLYQQIQDFFSATIELLRIITTKV